MLIAVLGTIYFGRVPYRRERIRPVLTECDTSIMVVLNVSNIVTFLVSTTTVGGDMRFFD